MKKLIFLLVGIFMISSVYALGVSPGRTTLNFKPGLQRTVNFEVINSGNTDMKLLLSVQGKLAKYITFPASAVSISANEHSKTLSYIVHLPEKLEPGLQTGEIFIMEIPETDNSGSSRVLATLAVVTQLYVNIPYPGKFAVSKMVIYNANQGKDVTFVFPVISKGEFNLTSVRANVDIYNSLNKKVDSFDTNSIKVPSGEKKEIIYNWKADVPIGDYRALATLSYDTGTIDLEGTFSVGSKELELQEITVNGFHLGQIVKLEMLVENKWSEPIKGVFIDTKIKDNQGDIVSTFKSAEYTIKPLAKQVFLSYWDTAGVKVGDYQAEVSINYGGKVSKKSLKFKVSENDLTIIGLGYVISPGGKSTGMKNIITILIIAIILLGLINLMWFFLLRKKLKK